MEISPQDREQYAVTISGPVSGQVAVGRSIQQVLQVTPSSARQDTDDLESLLQALDALREQVSAVAPLEKQPAALERVEELAAAVTAAKPDLSTMEYVRNWFARNLPALAGAVTGVIVNPILGRLVEAAGDALAAEFRRRFGIA